MRNKAGSLLLLICMLIISAQAIAQNLTKSPYSSFGAGEMNFTGTAKQFSMGQLGQSMRGLYEINSLNPASYTALKQTAIEGGATYSLGNISTVSGQSPIDNFSFTYIKLAMCVSQKLKWGLAFGLEPYTNVGYKATSNTATPGYSAQILQEGTGGLNRFYAGSGIAVYKDSSTIVSIGFQAAYLFGQMSNSKAILIPVDYSKFNLQEDRRTIVRDFQFQYGAQVSKDIKKDYTIVLGATYTQQASLRTKEEYFAKSMGIGGTQGVQDTISFKNNEGVIQFPYQLSAGAGLEKKDKWFVGADVSFGNWADYRVLGRSDSLKNTIGISVGGSWVPNNMDFKNYLNRIEYRAGARFDNGSLNIYGKDIVSYGVSAGVGLPLGKTRSKLNISLEYYVKGMLANSLIKEEYFRFVFGISFTDRWFQRYKYD